MNNISGHPFILPLAVKGVILLIVSVNSSLVYANPAISKDGSSIVYALPNPSDSSNWEIWKVNKNDSDKVGAPSTYSKPVLISEKHILFAFNKMEHLVIVTNPFLSVHL